MFQCARYVLRAGWEIFSFWNYENASHFTGYADNLRVYSRALTPEEITILYAPQLTVQRLQESILVHWSVDLTGYLLESAGGLNLQNWHSITSQQ